MKPVIQYHLTGAHRREIRMKGFYAALDGKLPSACPYRRDSNKADVWLDGYFSYEYY